MILIRRRYLPWLAALALMASLYMPANAVSQVPIELPGDDAVVFDEPGDEETAADEERAIAEDEEGEDRAVPGLDEVMGDFEGREAGEAETRWGVKVNAAVRANYVFNESSDSFVIKYTFELEGEANADTAVIRGDANISADVEGTLARWPTGQCSLNVSIPKVPFEITFRKSEEEKGSVSLQFRKPIMEDWKSSCTFTDAPGARFETSGPPEKWLAIAIEKARPPIRSIVADITDEETTTSFVISKQVIDDAPLGSVEVEGTGVLTITPGG
ncbi:MAG: hypothetical protein WC683_18070 [bacterium]